MIIHEIHDLSNIAVIDLLKEGLSKNVNDVAVENYHPDYMYDPGNLFYVLEQGRYQQGFGKYFVIEENGIFVASAGWNHYDLEESTALVLARAYTNQDYRNKYYLGNYILPKCIEETVTYDKVWITVNEYNKALYTWAERYQKTKNLAGWPAVYGNFKPVGKHDIYYIPQYVVELMKDIK